MSEQEYELQAEIRKLLNILNKSLYQHKEIFLRESISLLIKSIKNPNSCYLRNLNILKYDSFHITFG
jgi:HSP90 family molecular chaperone